MNVTINDQNLVELVDTWFPNPVYGDMDYEMRYTQYQDFGGVKFPELVHVHQGDPRLNPAHNYYECKITGVKANVPVTTMPVPEAVRTATRRRCKVESQKLADGVWALAGGTHNSMLVEFRDFVAVVEAPNNEARSLAVIAEAGRLVPNKPIQIPRQHPPPFRSCRRPAARILSQGTTIVTHESNKQYYLDIMFYPAPRTLDPDRMATYKPMYMISRRPAPIETVGGDTRDAPYVVTDGVRMLEVFHVQDMAYELGDPSLRQGNHGAGHVDGLPAEREDPLQRGSLFAACAGAALPAPTAASKTLYQNIAQAEARRRAARAGPRPRRRPTTSS